MASKKQLDPNSQKEHIMKLKENVKQLENLVISQKQNSLSYEWEEDVQDPMEQAMMHRGASSHGGRGRGKNWKRGGEKGVRGHSNRGRSNWRGSHRGRSDSGNWREEPASTQGYYNRSRSPSFSEYSSSGPPPYSDYSSSSLPSYSDFHSTASSASFQPSVYGSSKCSQFGPDDHYYNSDAYYFRPKSRDRFSSASRKDSTVSPSELAKILSECVNFQSTLLCLVDEHNLDHHYVRNMASVARNVFEIDKETVRLCPKVELCDDHVTDGCESLKTCNKLHLCSKYLTKSCSEKKCILGHDLFTNHNKKVLNNFNLSLLPTKHLLTLLNSNVDKINLKICEDYNRGECQKEDCSEAHLCLKNLAKCCSSSEECQLNHSISGKSLKSLLDLSGISTNESPRDVFLRIASCPLVKDQIETLKSQMKASDGAKDEETSSEKGKEKASKKEEDVLLRTVWSNEFKGEVTLDEICFASVEGLCPYEEKGCWRLHCDLHFHWQVKSSKTLSPFWANLTKEQVIALEKAYVCPETEVVDLPALSIDFLGSNLKGLLLLLNGRSKWEAHFSTMSLKCVGQADVLELRRLCTEDVSNQVIEPCIFKWYFLDKNKKWVEYGQVDTTGEEKLKCNADSDALEKQYKQKAMTFQFSSLAFRYSIDFKTMLQKNLHSNVVREVRRRPMPHFKEEKTSNLKSDLPLFWEPMGSDERMRRVVLAHSSDEYQKITSFVNGQAGTFNILKIERVQNPYLWKAFQNKVAELTILYKSKSVVDVRQLFHGTKPDVVPKICMENFDWRLHGTSTGQSYGRGTYFSPSLQLSQGYTAADGQGNRYMFIAQVIVGTVTTGNSGMARPPINPTYSVPYDSTVNSLQNPSIIVKYDKQEYFPEYIITYT